MKPTATHRPEEVTSEMIATRAYERFVQRGGEHGHDLEDWLAAEKELRGPTASTTPRRPRVARLTRVK